MKNSGFSLIELVVFIVVISIVAVGVAMLIATLLQRSPITERLSDTLSVAQARMELILGQRYFVGYNRILKD